MDNFEVDTLTNLNKLARRHHLRPSDFRAELQAHEARKCPVVEFALLANDSSLVIRNYRSMLLNLGIRPGEQELIGSRQSIAEAIDHALRHTPEKQTRRR